MSVSETSSRKRSSSGFCVWRGLGVRNWCRLLPQCPAFPLSRFGWLASLSLTSVANSLLHVLESAFYARRIENVRIEHPPVFILGHWRSGTTLLHNLFARDPQFTYPNLYQVSFPGHFLLTERVLTQLTARWLPKTRPVDNMSFGWDLPQEDETALLLTTLLSPYLMVAFPDDRLRYERFGNLKKGLSQAEFETWQHSFVHFLKKLTCRNPKPLVLKSPTHTGRIPILLEMFPDARFIHIVRDPYVVFSSTVHLREVLCQINSLSCATPGQTEELIFRGYLDLYHAYHLYRPLIPRGNLYELRFEDLQDDPIGELRKIYEQFNFSGFDVLQARLQETLGDHHDYRKNEYELNEDVMRRIYDRWKPAFQRYGYPSRLPPEPLSAAAQREPD